MRRNPTRSAHARSSDRSWPTVATPGKWSAATVSRHDHTAAGRLRGWQLAWHGADDPPDVFRPAPLDDPRCAAEPSTRART
jgi:hypothetical protein